MVTFGKCLGLGLSRDKEAVSVVVEGKSTRGFKLLASCLKPVKILIFLKYIRWSFLPILDNIYYACS